MKCAHIMHDAGSRRWVGSVRREKQELWMLGVEVSPDRRGRRKESEEQEGPVELLLKHRGIKTESRGRFSSWGCDLQELSEEGG